jgi:hypothetical protein
MAETYAPDARYHSWTKRSGAMTKKNENPAKKDRSKSEDAKLDDALDHSFPASDPPSMIEPHPHLGDGKEKPPQTNRPLGR